MNNEEEVEDTIPLKNLPNAGLVAWKYDPWKEGDPVSANNVLIACIDNLKSVSIVGHSKEDGTFYFASNLEDTDEVIEDLDAFKRFLKRFG
jgi:hypothetical protein